MGATLPPFLQFMPTALHRVIATGNPFKSPTTMAAAGNFYSIVAGVGAGTGRSVAINFAQTSKLRIHRQGDQHRGRKSNRHINRRILGILYEERIRRDTKGVQGQEPRSCSVQCWGEVREEALLGAVFGRV